MVALRQCVQMLNMKQYSPLEVANTIIARHGKYCHDLGHMKLQKLVYMVHGWWLAHHEDAILNEKPQMWKHGAVFKSMYHVLKVYGSKRLKNPVQIRFDEEPYIIKDKEVICLIDWVWNKYGHLSAEELSTLVHQKGTAWRTVAIKHNYIVPKHMSIENKYVKAEFEAYLKKFQGANSAEA